MSYIITLGIALICAFLGSGIVSAVFQLHLATVATFVVCLLAGLQIGHALAKWLEYKPNREPNNKHPSPTHPTSRSHEERLRAFTSGMKRIGDDEPPSVR